MVDFNEIKTRPVALDIMVGRDPLDAFSQFLENQTHRISLTPAGKLELVSHKEGKDCSLRAVVDKVYAFTTEYFNHLDKTKDRMSKTAIKEIRALREGLRLIHENRITKQRSLIGKIAFIIKEFLFGTQIKLNVSMQQIDKIMENIVYFSDESVGKNREDLPFTSLDAEGKKIEGMASSYKQYERRLPRSHHEVTFATLLSQEGVMGIEDLVAAFENARVKENKRNSRDDQTLSVNSSLADVLSQCTSTTTTEELYLKLLRSIRNFNLKESFNEGEELLGPLSKKLDTPREVKGLREGMIKRVMPDVERVIKSSEFTQVFDKFKQSLYDH